MTTERTWKKVKAGVYTSDGFIVEKKWDRAVGTQWRLKNLGDPQARHYTWCPTLADAKDTVTYLDAEAEKEAAPKYHVSVTTWDHGRGHSQALADGPVKDHLLGLAKQSLGLLPEITKVEFHCTNHSVITVYRKDNA